MIRAGMPEEDLIISETGKEGAGTSRENHLEVDDGHLVEELHGWRLLEAPLLPVPPRSVQKQTLAVCTFLGVAARSTSQRSVPACRIGKGYRYMSWGVFQILGDVYQSGKR